MSDGDEETFNAVELEGGHGKSPNAKVNPQETSEASKPAPQAEAWTVPSAPKSQEKPNRWVNAVDQFKMKRFFVLRVLNFILTALPDMAELIWIQYIWIACNNGLEATF